MNTREKLKSLLTKIKEYITDRKDKPLMSLLIKTAFLLFFGFLLYFALRQFNFLVTEPVNAALGILALSLAIALLLVADEAQVKRHICSKPESREKTGGNNGHSVLHGLLRLCVERSALIVLAFLLIPSGIVVLLSIADDLLTIGYSNSTGLDVRIGNQTLHSFPISSSIGWQNTKIRLKKEELFQVEVLGQVSPGYVQNLDEKKRYIKEIIKWVKEGSETGKEPSDLKTHWPFSGPEGYNDDDYEIARENAGYIHDDYKKDSALTVQGLPHNVVVGVVIPGGEKPEDQYDWETGCPLKKSEPNSNEREIDCSLKKPKPILLSVSPGEYPITRQAPASGILWVVINDAEGWRMDNAGQFFMKILVR